MNTEIYRKLFSRYYDFADRFGVRRALSLRYHQFALTLSSGDSFRQEKDFFNYDVVINNRRFPIGVQTSTNARELARYLLNLICKEGIYERRRLVELSCGDACGFLMARIDVVTGIVGISRNSDAFQHLSWEPDESGKPQAAAFRFSNF